MVPNLLLDNIITEMKYSTPSTIKLLIIQGFSDEILIKHEIGLESAGQKTLPSVKISHDIQWYSKPSDHLWVIVPTCHCVDLIRLFTLCKGVLMTPLHMYAQVFSNK